ncbi:MFS general substrate transporter [Gloeopeniophorella convolvens]|nr:MFS general substrate transporter [Gloeopeniophorella convolvens]
MSSTSAIDGSGPNEAGDIEKATISTVIVPSAHENLDIEHVHVEDDPRKWSRARKLGILGMIFCASMIAGLGANIFNPSINEVEADLNASPGEISWSLSVYIIVQGGVPILWTAISEVKGRKLVYVVSLAIATVGCIIAAEAQSIGVLIGMRALQAMGSSSVVALGAATLADIYEPAERGTMMGIFYAAPLLGPSLGPIVGGILTQAFSWRATFWLLAAIMGANFVLFLFFFRDTFRRERSLAYQRVLSRHKRQADTKRSSIDSVAPVLSTKAEEAAETTETPHVEGSVEEVSLGLSDVNPLPSLFMVLRRWNNVITLTASGFFFAFGYCISYTSSRTLADKYHYDSLKIGLTLLAYGSGSILGSLLGGRWSDRVLRRLTEENGGRRVPEMRLDSMKPVLLFLPLPVVAYGWLAQEHIHIASVCVMLFFSGFFSIWIYSSTLAYIVDANPGRSSAAVATNSCFRGLAAFAFTEAAVPLQNAIGDGGLYSLWAGVLVLCEVLLLLVRWRGGLWRERAEERERE